MIFIMPNNETISIIVDAMQETQCEWFGASLFISLENEEEIVKEKQRLGQQLADYVLQVHNQVYAEKWDYRKFEYIPDRKYNEFLLTFQCIRMYMYQCSYSDEWVTSEMSYYLQNLCIQYVDHYFMHLSKENSLKSTLYWGYNEDTLELMLDVIEQVRQKDTKTGKE